MSPRAGNEDSSVKDVPSHGASGYKRGCRCFTCRRGHSDAMNRQRERRKVREGQKLAPKPGQDAGRVETTTMALIEDLELTGTTADMLIALAQTNARFIDTINKEGRLHLMSGAQRNLLETMDRLAALKPRKGDEDEDDFLAGLQGAE